MSGAWIGVVGSLSIAVLGMIGVVSPETLRGIAEQVQTPAGLYGAAAFRVVLGVALLLAAPGSRAPRAIRVIGALLVVAGVITPILGIERFHGILTWWSELAPVFMRSWAAVALVFGAVLAYVLVPRSRIR